MTETTTEQRLGKLETEFAIVKNDLTVIGRSLTEFRGEWAKKAEDDRTAHRAARLTLPQIAGIVFGAVSTTAILLGGLMVLVNMQVGTARADLTLQIQAMRQTSESAVREARQAGEANTAQVGLAVRGQGDSVTALNTAFQAMQREQAVDRVKLGLVEQSARISSTFIDKAQSFDALMAAHEERLKALEQIVRDAAARRPQS
ncbi:hypothetical protein [Bosea sp. ASV33]|uniref:hypothetical protein n=1 Tax=Bosea sp. ASV33 TaxID=2795106 RepID=UPI0018EC6C9B|nr:hypothetical protein [Bosea sp. ASV33]